MAIIRNRKKVEPVTVPVEAEKETPPETSYADIGDALVMGLEPEPEPTAVEEEPTVEEIAPAPPVAEETAEPAKRGRGRPRGSTKQRELPKLLELPEGMTDDIMAWACNVSTEGNAVYRWRAGFNPMPEIARLMIALWNALGEDEFLRLMTLIRKSEPPQTKPPTFERLAIESFGDGEEVQSLGDIHEYVTAVRGREISRRALGSILSRMKNNGELESEERDQWRLAKG